MNGVGYGTTINDDEALTMIGADFLGMGDNKSIPLNNLVCPQGFEEGDQIQVAFTADSGLTELKVYEYWESDGGWADTDEMEIVGDDIGFDLGKGAWFAASTPKTIQMSGEVKGSHHIHVFTDVLSIISSAFPTGFCPNSANVSWACSEGDQIQVPFLAESGLTELKVYEYWESDGGWADTDEMDLIAPDFVVAPAGKGFWFACSDPTTVSCTEVSPIAD